MPYIHVLYLVLENCLFGSDTAHSRRIIYDSASSDVPSLCDKIYSKLINHYEYLVSHWPLSLVFVVCKVAMHQTGSWPIIKYFPLNWLTGTTGSVPNSASRTGTALNLMILKFALFASRTLFLRSRSFIKIRAGKHSCYISTEFGPMFLVHVENHFINICASKHGCYIRTEFCPV